jgi:hypothetical protein
LLRKETNTKTAGIFVPFDGCIALLTIFQNLVNPSDEAQISVTLNVHGTLVSGTMIGMKRYYEEVSKKVSGSVRAKSEEELSCVKKELQKLFAMIKQPPSKKEIETSDNRYDHIILKDSHNTCAIAIIYWVFRMELYFIDNQCRIIDI